jgi:hypothetical protein
MSKKQLRNGYHYLTDEQEEVVIQIAYECDLAAASPEQRLAIGGFEDRLWMYSMKALRKRRHLTPRHVIYQFPTGYPQRVYVRTREYFHQLLSDPQVVGYVGERAGIYTWKPLK